MKRLLIDIQNWFRGSTPLSTTATFEYKCRRCGKVSGQDGIGARYADVALIRALGGERSGNAPPLLVTHSCADKGMGVADLIGYGR